MKMKFWEMQREYRKKNNNKLGFCLTSNFMIEKEGNKDNIQRP